MISYVIAIGCSFGLAAIVSFFWVRNIDYMKKNHPNYKGEDLFDEYKEEDTDYLG